MLYYVGGSHCYACGVTSNNCWGGAKTGTSCCGYGASGTTFELAGQVETLVAIVG